MEQLATLIGFVLTLLIFSYILADNFLYRLAIYSFIGISAAYTVLLIVLGVLLPMLTTTAEIIIVLVALALTGLLLAKPLARLSGVTNLGLAFLMAVGAAVAVVGAITGTLIPLTVATGQAVGTQGIVDGVIVIVGVITALMYFQYSGKVDRLGQAQRGTFNRVLATIGQSFIAITLGALYGTAILTSLTLLTERLGFLFGAVS